MYAVLGCSILVSVNPRGRANLVFTHSDKFELAEEFLQLASMENDGGSFQLRREVLI